jgi:FAD/FMN-containing dehydrogenase
VSYRERFVEWKNWSGRLACSPGEIVIPKDELEIVSAVRASAVAGRRVRCVGAGHSHSRLVLTNETLIDMASISGVVRADLPKAEVTVRGGTRISALGPPLRELGLALCNQGDIDRQAIAGAVATGTHGTGPTLPNLSASVVGARIVLANGDVVDTRADLEPDLFKACQVSLGALGVMSEITLAVREPYRLEEQMWLDDLDEVLGRIDELTQATRHFEFFWQPGGTRIACKSLAETTAPVVTPLGKEGTRLSWSYEVLANERDDRHSEMEYSIPAESGPECMAAIRDLIAHDFPDLSWPVEYRTLASDDVWLSTAKGRETVTISIHQGIDVEDEPLFRACEKVFLSYAGRPHWGKVHYLGGESLRTAHEDWDEWWRVRDSVDPEGRFLNPYLAELAGRGK